MSSSRVIRIGDMTLSPAEKAIIMQVCDSNRVTEHSRTAEFERRWAEKIGTKYSVAMSSGTAGLISGYSALKYLSGDKRRTKVITTPVSFIATSNAVKIAGLEPVFADIHKETFGMLESEVERILGSGDASEFLAISPVYLMGYPGNVDAIMKLAKKHGVFVFEDAAQAHCSKYRGANVGTFGDLSGFSFYIAHNLQAGELGAVNTNNKELRNLLRRIKAHGRICACDVCRRMEGKCPEMKKHAGEEDFDPRYTHDLIGYNFKADEFSAALATARMQQVEESNRKRRANVKFLNESLVKYSDDLQLPPYSEDVSYLGYPIIARKDGARKQIRAGLENQGIETRTLFGCIPTSQPSFGYLKKEYEGKLPNAEYVGRNGFFIGCHQDISPADLERIVKSFEEIMPVCK